MDCKAYGVYQPGITCHSIPMISGRETRQKHRAEATEVPWEHATRTSGATSAAVGLLGVSPERQAGGRLAKGALAESG